LAGHFSNIAESENPGLAHMWTGWDRLKLIYL
jgi:hypothetical protein